MIAQLSLFGHYMTGATNGLSLILNVEQYEYMRGPQTDAGVKVSIHSGNIFKQEGISVERQSPYFELKL